MFSTWSESTPALRRRRLILNGDEIIILYHQIFMLKHLHCVLRETVEGSGRKHLFTPDIVDGHQTPFIIQENRFKYFFRPRTSVY